MYVPAHSLLALSAARVPQGVLESQAAAGIMQTRTPALLSEGDDERAMSPLLERQASGIPVSRNFVPVFQSVQSKRTPASMLSCMTAAGMMIECYASAPASQRMSSADVLQQVLRRTASMVAGGGPASLHTAIDMPSGTPGGEMPQADSGSADAGGWSSSSAASTPSSSGAGTYHCFGWTDPPATPV